VSYALREGRDVVEGEDGFVDSLFVGLDFGFEGSGLAVGEFGGAKHFLGVHDVANRVGDSGGEPHSTRQEARETPVQRHRIDGLALPHNQNLPFGAAEFGQGLAIALAGLG